MNRPTRYDTAFVRTLAWAAVLGVQRASAQASEAASGSGFDGPHLVRGVADTLVFALLGIGLLAFGYKLFARIVPWDVDHEIAKDHNVAAAIVLASLFLSIAIVIAAALVS